MVLAGVSSEGSGLISRLKHAWHLVLSSIFSDYSKKPIGIEAFQRRGLAFSDIFYLVDYLVDVPTRIFRFLSHIPLGHTAA